MHSLISLSQLKAFNEERCPGIKEGGWLLELVHKLPVYASGDTIPDYLMIDLRGLKVGDKIMASHVELNDGLLLRSRVRDFCIARIVGSRRGVSAGEPESAAAGAATPAAGGIAAAAAAAKPAASKPAAGAAGGAKPAAKA